MTVLRAALLGLAIGVPAFAETTVTSLLEAGSFAHAYRDLQYVHPTEISFSVPYGAWGAEVDFRDQNGAVWGIDAAQSFVASGEIANFNEMERQPTLLLNYAAIYVGRDWHWWEADLGIGGLVQVQDFDAEPYWNPDGTTSSGRSAGMDWNRRESFTLINSAFRLLPSDGPHVWFRVGRGAQSLTEDLFRIEGFWPVSWGDLWAGVSFSSPWGYWISGSGVLRNNERLTVGWRTADRYLSWGARVGFLIRPMVSGTGDVDFLQRWSISVVAVMTLPDRKTGDQRE